MPYAVIFDMNGVLIDDIPFHKRAWLEFARIQGITLDDEEFDRNLNGRQNRDIFTQLLGREISDTEFAQLEATKEQIYRDTYREHRRLLPGLIEFLNELREKDIAMAVATSAPVENIEFILDDLEIRSFFSAVIDPIQVSKSKPDPEIFLTAAEKLGSLPKHCLVFEDSLQGIDAAMRAGMLVVGITTTQTAQTLMQRGARITFDDFQSCNYAMLETLLDYDSD